VIVVDTGPIVALLNDRDDHHQRCRDFLANHPGPLLLPTTVFTEVCMLAERRRGTHAELAFLADVRAGRPGCDAARAVRYVSGGPVTGRSCELDARIRIEGGDGEDFAALGEWLSDEEELRGRVRTIRRPIGETELGSVTDLLTVALEAGGAGSVLASALITWLRTRRTSARITVECAGRSVTLDIHTIDDVAPLLERVLQFGDDH
jgi:hypothetical protein